MFISGGNVLLQRTRFVGNSVFGYDGEAYGGAIYNGGAVLAIDCDFEDNSVRGLFTVGGAIATSGRLDMANCRLLGNEASSDDWGALGGAIYASGGQTTITNCLLAQNEAQFWSPSWCEPADESGAFGAAFCLAGSASVVVQSSTLAGNVSGSGCGGGLAYLFGSQTFEIANSIIWGSGADAIATFQPGATVEVTFSDLEGGWPGEGNIDVDPMFVNPVAGDYRLSAGSPAADAGANDLVPPDTFDLDGNGDVTEPLPLDLMWNPRFTDDPAAPDTGRGPAPIVDMGAYETVVDGCYADCDGSADLDFFDFLCFQNAFAPAEPYADCDGSRSHDFFDFLCFQNAFAAGCP